MRPVSSLCGAIVVFLSALGCYASGQKQELGMVFNRHPQPFIAPLGDEVFFECSLNLAAEKFAWRHRPLGSNKWEPFIQIPNSGGKTSKHVVTCDDESKAGDYRCVAFYGTSGLASDPARLTIAKIDKFSDKSDVEIKVPVGNTVPITCPVPYSAPEPVIQFYKDNNPIQSATISGSRTMIIENARPSDSGKYHCTANNYITNQMYLSNYNTILTVESNQTHQNPYFIKQPQTEYKVQRGKNISLECFGAGNPVPFVTWSKLGSSLPIKSFNTPSGLTIVNAQPADRGEYDCVWSNGRYKIKSVIILTVVEAPKVVKPPKGLTFAEGGELDLSCSVTGQPEPTVEWLINGETLVPNNNVEIRGATLSISVVEKKHAGIVQCVASNEYGSHSGYNLLRVTPKQHVGGAVESREDFGVPSSRHKHTRVGGRRRGKGRKRKGPDVLVPPEQPQVTRLSDMSVMVRWSVPENNGLEIQFFKVQYREFGPKVNNGKQAKWMTANTEIPNHVRSFEVTELQPGHTYRFRIAAVYSNNDNKLSPNSVKFHLHRNTGFNPNKMPIPLFTNTEALSPHRILLIWQNPDKSVDIDGFYVYHRASTSAGDYLKTTVEGKNSSRIVISHLQPDTTYEFKVQSFSVDMASEFSKILREKTKKLPVDVPVEQVLPENKPKPVETPKNSNLYAIIGGVLGGGILIGGIVAITLAYRRSKSKQNRDSSQDQAKPMTNGRVMNGGITDSKINITSNPLAGLDAVDDALQPKSGQQQSPMEMASFLNGQNNNSNSSSIIHNSIDPTTGTALNSSTPHEQPSSPPPPPSHHLQGPVPIDQPL